MPLAESSSDPASPPCRHDPFACAVCGPLRWLTHSEAGGADRRGGELRLTSHVAHRFLRPDRVIRKDSGVLLA